MKSDRCSEIKIEEKSSGRVLQNEDIATRSVADRSSKTLAACESHRLRTLKKTHTSQQRPRWLKNKKNTMPPIFPFQEERREQDIVRYQQQTDLETAYILSNSEPGLFDTGTIRIGVAFLWVGGWVRCSPRFVGHACTK
jgi:hypothetical protein